MPDTPVDACRRLRPSLTTNDSACLMTSSSCAAPSSRSSLAHPWMIIMFCSMCCISSLPRAMPSSSMYLITHKHKDLGSIKLSSKYIAFSTKREFTCCSSSLARALVIGPILISSLDLFFAATGSSSLSIGEGVMVGMSSSRTACAAHQVQQARQL